MKRFIVLLTMITGTAGAQFTPPAISGYQWNGSVWTPLTTTATLGAIGFTPPAVSLYCYNSGTGQWAPADSSCLGGGGGSGTVTSFSAGTLSPLFTTSVATATTTPALTFSLSNAAANSVLANPTGSSAAPVYSASPTIGNTTIGATPAASTSALSSTGIIFTGGSGTTTFPYWMMQPSTATAETAWSANGTFLGINSSAGFTGNFLDAHVNNGGSVFNVTSGGAINAGGAITGSSFSAGSISVTGANRGAGFISQGTKFTATGCTSITTTVGGGTAGKFTIGGNTCTVVITMNGATGLTAPNGYSCRANDETTAAGNTGLYFSTNNATTATLTVPAAAAASDVIDFSCTAY